jgi:ADP-ribose pyrophosphatase YjhB (NUDIX family)
MALVSVGEARGVTNTPSAELVDELPVVDGHGRVHLVPRHTIQYSPAVYGILVEENRTLLCTHPTSGFYQFPGGHVALGQTVEQAMRQQFRTATGITPYVGQLLLTEEMWLWDETSGAWNLTHLYYRLSRPPIGHMGLIDFENPAKPDWVPLPQLQRTQLQFGYDALQLALKQTV